MFESYEQEAERETLHVGRRRAEKLNVLYFPNSLPSPRNSRAEPTVVEPIKLGFNISIRLTG
jgi:hypothetical protein